MYSEIVNWEDRGTCVLFGDGAAAVLVSQVPGDGKSGIFESVLGSRGSGTAHLLRPTGGSRRAFEPGKTPPNEQYLSMNGRQVYIFAVAAITDTINSLLEKNDLSMDQIDYIIPHQANRRIIEAACKRNGWPEEKFFMNMERYANTSAASIPLAMDEMFKKGMLERGQKILTVGFGAGLTYGGNFLSGKNSHLRQVSNQKSQQPDKSATRKVGNQLRDFIETVFFIQPYHATPGQVSYTAGNALPAKTMRGLPVTINLQLIFGGIHMPAAFKIDDPDPLVVSI